MASQFKIEFLKDDSRPTGSGCYIHCVKDFVTDSNTGKKPYISLVDKEVYENKLPASEKNYLATALFNQLGVAELSIKAYQIFIIKAESFEWGNMGNNKPIMNMSPPNPYERQSVLPISVYGTEDPGILPTILLTISSGNASERLGMNDLVAQKQTALNDAAANYWQGMTDEELAAYNAAVAQTQQELNDAMAARDSAPVWTQWDNSADVMGGNDLILNDIKQRRNPKFNPYDT